MDVADDDVDGRVGGELFGHLEEEAKMAEEKAMRGFRLQKGKRTRSLISDELEKDRHNAGTSTHQITEAPAVDSKLPQQAGHGQDQHGAKGDDDEFSRARHDP